ncbi:hypothetical protein SHKM778_22800 [Streptomyces sp. KM77-8]|uniref:TAXI family TRAP transporter solute-binding subunit n=1 Tax=Streptomyces haneummycinicus TaxID=3074435 RepID=A0AAT9HER5_9ACTN
MCGKLRRHLGRNIPDFQPERTMKLTNQFCRRRTHPATVPTTTGTPAVSSALVSAHPAWQDRAHAPHAVPHRQAPALRAATAGLVVLGILLWWLAPGTRNPGWHDHRQHGHPRGVYQKYGELLRSSLGKHMPDLDVRLVTSDGSQENVRRVATGEADFAIAAADAVETYRLEGRPGADRLRGVARLYDDYVQLAVARDSGIRTVDDLRGKHVAIGPPKSGFG